ncbi:unnamed protein product [Parnassius apollo]|uniref:(apollo) hypothetical protein n=1 Tax=Parnassius apollo TaxID=110799 RepID=A0A8S3WBK1_PARAO|nr:unnamed protein product [Parnassius apollo]
MYKYDQYQLKLCYEEITVAKIDEQLPHYFCFECAMLLYKYHKFKQKCFRGQAALKALLLKGPITYKAVNNSNCKSEILQSALGIITVNKRVKTYLINDGQNRVIHKKVSIVNGDGEVAVSMSTEDVTKTSNRKAELEVESDKILTKNDSSAIKTTTDNLLSSTDNVDDDLDYAVDTDNDNHSLTAVFIPEKDLVIKTEEDNLENTELNDNNIDKSNKQLPQDKLSQEKLQNSTSKRELRKYDFPVAMDTGSVTKITDKNIDFGIKSDEILIRTGSNAMVTVASDVLSIMDDSVNNIDCDSVNEKSLTTMENNVLIKSKKCNDHLDVAVKKIKKSVSNKKILGTRKHSKIENNKNVQEEKKHKFTATSKKVLDPSKWKKISLSEEEAVKEFEKRAHDPKYVQATYHCKDCYKFFSREDIMMRHLKLRHNTSIGPFECRFCHMRFKLKCRLLKHTRMHYTKYECLVCNLVVTVESTALMHEEAHLGVTRTCKHCGEEFRHLTTYYSHLRTHRSKFVCTLCGASFVSDAGLQQHKRVKHVDDTEQSKSPQDAATFCNRCQINFITASAFAEHLKSSALHADVEKAGNNEVTTSKKKYRRPRYGRTTKLKPTTCHQCGKHFDSQTLYLNHHLKEHPRTSIFPPNERHICEICGASLAPGSIAMHQNIHTREKLYKCETCGRDFYSSASLKRHLVKHTGEKPFKCPLCDKRFTQDSSMKLHYRTFHLKQPYPKRTRNKKKEEIQEVIPMETEEESYSE